MNREKMKKWLLCSMVGHLLVGLASSAQALTTTVTNGSFSSVAGAYTVDFGSSPVNNSGSVAGSAAAGSTLLSGAQGGVQYTYTDGALYNYDPYPASNLANGISARPPGSTGNYWSIGNYPAEQQGPGVVSFSAGVRYFGFLWGSPDSYNQVSIFDGNTQLGSTLDGSAILVPPNGDQNYARYFNIFAGPGEAITKIVFSSATNAFETDNHAFLPGGGAVRFSSPVPEPDTYAMVLAGLGLMGFTAHRRKSRNA